MVKFQISALVASVATVLLHLGLGWSSERTPPAPPNTTPAPTRTADEQPPAQGPVDVAPPPHAPVASVKSVDGGAAGQPGGVNFVVQESTVEQADSSSPRRTCSRRANFVVPEPTAEQARGFASEAETLRRRLALKWLGQELPAWPKPCPIRFSQGLGAPGGAATFTFGTNKAGKPVVDTVRLELHGDFKSALTVVLPHEVMHTVLASYFGQPVPRWADEGIALLAEPDGEQQASDARAREFLNAGRGIRLKVLLPMTEYPRDLSVFYAQGHSLARYLASTAAPTGTTELKDLPYVGELFRTEAAGHRRVLAFVHLGMQGNTTESWAKAANTVYGFKSLDDLEEAWLAWLAKPESVMKPQGDKPPVAGRGKSEQNEERGGSDMIPPMKLPTAPKPQPPAPTEPPTKPPTVPKPQQPAPAEPPPIPTASPQ